MHNFETNLEMQDVVLPYGPQTVNFAQVKINNDLKLFINDN